jgi:hypothetical protein
MPADIVGVNVPGLRRIINLEISGDIPLCGTIGKVAALVRGSWRLRFATEDWN